MHVIGDLRLERDLARPRKLRGRGRRGGSRVSSDGAFGWGWGLGLGAERGGTKEKRRPFLGI